MPLCCVWWACSSGFTKSALSVEPLLLNEVLIMLRFSFTSLSLSPFLCFFYFCMCHAARGKSLQPDCEMMSQIHKTLTGSFQILFIIYHPYFIFLWEDLYGCVQAYTCWCTLCCVCCCGCAHICHSSLHGVVWFIYLETTNVQVHVCHLSRLFLTSGLVLRLKRQSNFAAPLKLLHSFFPLL